MSDMAILLVGLFAFGCVVAVCMTVDSVAARKYGGKGAGHAKPAREWPQMPMWTVETREVKPGEELKHHPRKPDDGGDAE